MGDWSNDDVLRDERDEARAEVEAQAEQIARMNREMLHTEAEVKRLREALNLIEREAFVRSLPAVIEHIAHRALASSRTANTDKEAHDG